jgi:hypothetical protein
VVHTIEKRGICVDCMYVKLCMYVCMCICAYVCVHARMYCVCVCVGIYVFHRACTDYTVQQSEEEEENRERATTQEYKRAPNDRIQNSRTHMTGRVFAIGFFWEDTNAHGRIQYTIAEYATQLPSLMQLRQRTSFSFSESDVAAISWSRVGILVRSSKRLSKESSTREKAGCGICWRKEPAKLA